MAGVGGVDAGARQVGDQVAGGLAREVEAGISEQDDIGIVISDPVAGDGEDALTLRVGGGGEGHRPDLAAFPAPEGRPQGANRAGFGAVEVPLMDDLIQAAGEQDGAVELGEEQGLDRGVVPLGVVDEDRLGEVSHAALGEQAVGPGEDEAGRQRQRGPPTLPSTTARPGGSFQADRHESRPGSPRRRVEDGFDESDQ